MLGALLLTPRLARTNSGHNFYETVGISMAAGTVLGASTLPFYSQPGIQLMNLVYGASLRAFTRLGIWFHGSMNGPSGERNSDASFFKHPQLKFFVQSSRSFFVTKAHNSTFIQASESHLVDPVALTQLTGTARPALVWMPLVSLTW